MEALILGVSGAVITGIAGYYAARLKNSGTVDTSDAASLWAESNALRKEYKERAEQLEAQLKDVNTKLQSVMDELAQMKLSNINMAAKIAELERLIEELQRKNKELLELKQKDHV